MKRKVISIIVKQEDVESGIITIYFASSTAGAVVEIIGWI